MNTLFLQYTVTFSYKIGQYRYISLKLAGHWQQK